MLRTLTTILLLLSGAGELLAQTPGPVFEHVPLYYRGPDPTSNYFLPASTPVEPEPSIFTQLPPPTEVAPELRQPVQPGFETIPPGAIWPGQPGGGAPAPWPGGGQVVAAHAPISEHKNGFFQKAGILATYIDRRSTSGFGINEIDLFATVAVPAPTRRWPLLITSALNTRFLDGPVAPDVPARLYESYADFLWVPRLTDRWMLVLGIAPSLYGDSNVDFDDAFRLTGKAFVRFDPVPERVQLIAGVLYLNRDDIRLLPAGGIIWVPAENRRYELLFPKPQLAHRIRCGPGWEDWVYVGGEFGGNTFAFERAGTVDKITLRDYRVLLGLERKRNGGAGYRLEAGYVLGRVAEFASGLPDVNAKDTALVRGGVTF